MGYTLGNVDIRSWIAIEADERRGHGDFVLITLLA
jgi:hypothetical protein